MTRLENLNDNFLPENLIPNIGWRLQTHRPEQEDWVKGCYMGGSSEENNTFHFDTLEEAAEKVVELRQINADKNDSSERYEIADWEWTIELVYNLPGLAELQYAANQKLENLQHIAWDNHVSRRIEEARIQAENKARVAAEKAAEEKKAQEEHERQLYERLKRKFDQ